MKPAPSLPPALLATLNGAGVNFVAIANPPSAVIVYFNEDSNKEHFASVVGMNEREMDIFHSVTFQADYDCRKFVFPTLTEKVLRLDDRPTAYSLTVGMAASNEGERLDISRQAGIPPSFVPVLPTTDAIFGHRPSGSLLRAAIGISLSPTMMEGTSRLNGPTLLVKSKCSSALVPLLGIPLRGPDYSSRPVLRTLPTMALALSRLIEEGSDQ